MREILFRGKWLDNGEWVIGNYVYHRESLTDREGHYILILNGFGFSWCHVDPTTTGQYTGLTDKNGVKIFEGDYVHVHDAMLQSSKPYHEFNGFISFSDGAFVVIDGGWNTHYRLMDYEMEVIGNIFDNPEILGGIFRVLTREEAETALKNREATDDE